MNLSIISPCVYKHYESISLKTCALKRITQTQVTIINSYLSILVVENLYRNIHTKIVNRALLNVHIKQFAVRYKSA